MPDATPESDVQTKPLGDKARSRSAVIHAIAHLRWEREWFETFEVSRAKLLNTLSRLHEQMAANANAEQFLRYFLLSGQTVILEDVADVRPDLLTMLVIYNAGGRLGIGPWYVNVDESLVSGESLIRNLLIARSDASRYGLKLMHVAYTPEIGTHISQLPQILRAFGIDAAFIRHGAPIVYLPFRWESPDGSSILVVNHEARTAYPPTVPNIFAIADSIQAQRATRPEGPFVWMFDSGSASRALLDTIPKVEKQTNLPVVQTDLAEYVHAIRRELPDGMRASLKGELRQQVLRENAYLLPGTLSSRIYLKQANNHLQSYLTHAVEPWLTLALSHGKVEYPDNLHAMLTYVWRMLLKNQARHSLGGTAIDAVHEENEIRARRIADVGAEIVKGALNALPGKMHQQGTPVKSDKTHVVVWNPHNWRMKQAVEIAIELPAGKHPGKFATPTGEDLPFLWERLGDELGKLSFIADCPGIGYNAYTLQFSDDIPDVSYTPLVRSGTSITNVDGDTLFVEDGVLIWRHGEKTISNVLSFFDGGDAGDAYNYSPPELDVIVQADLIDDVQVESSPLYERLIMHHRMRVAPALRADRGRDRGVKLLELTTTATFYDHIPGVHFHTTFHNTAKDHRLRVHLRTDINNNVVKADAPFDLLERKIRQDSNTVFPSPEKPNLEGVTNIHPLHNVVAVQDDQHTLALIGRGLPEYEALKEDDQITVAMTLVRAIGWLSRGDLRSRTAQIAPMVEIPGAQCQRDITADYQLRFTPHDDPAALIRAGMEFNTPLQPYQYDERPQRPLRAFLSVVSDKSIGADSDGDGAIMTAFKPAERGDGWIVRFFNPHNHVVEILLTPHKRPEQVHLATISEASEGFLEADANGRVGVILNRHEIVTLRFIF